MIFSPFPFNKGDKISSVAGISNGDSVTIYRKGYQGIEHAGLKKILTTDNIFGILSVTLESC